MENQTPFYYKSTGAQIQICKGIHSCVCVHHCMSILTTFLFTQSRREIQRSWSMSCANPNAYVHLGEPNVCVSEHALNCDKGGWLRRKFQCDSLSQSNDVFHVFMAWGALQHLHRMDFYPTVKHLRAPAESREAKRNHKRSCCIRLSWTPTWIEITYQTQFLTHVGWCGLEDNKTKLHASGPPFNLKPSFSHGPCSKTWGDIPALLVPLMYSVFHLLIQGSGKRTSGINVKLFQHVAL